MVPYALGGSTVQGGNYGGYGGDAGGTVNASCTGTITTTFTWQPDPGQTLTSDPPPLNVILQETCMAAASGNSIPAATVGGSCDNGLGASQASLTQTVTPYGSPPIFYTEYGSGLVNSTRYQIITGTPTITLTCPASARVSCLQGTNASLRYTAAVYPVTISLAGTTLDGGLYKLLTGQQVTATLNSPYPVDPNSYAWDASNVFKDYNTSLASNQFVWLADADYFRPSFVFYDATSGILPLTCSATIICPDGTRLSVNVLRDITILKPTETPWTISTTAPDDGPFFYDYLVNGAFSPQYGVQVTWNPVAITVPPPFTGGQACFAQIASLNRVATRAALNGASNTYSVLPVSQGLDTGFPYKIAYQLDANGKLTPGANNKYPILSPPQWNTPGTGAGGDQPFTLCEPVLVNGDMGGSDWRSSTANDQFDTWTMYRPPAVGSQSTIWVPLKTIHWAWSGSASVHTDGNGNVITHPDGNAQWFYIIPPVNPAGNPTDTTAFPTWTAIIPYGIAMGPPPAH